MLKSASVGGLGSCSGGRKKAEDWEKSRDSEESVEMLISLSRWPPLLHSLTISSPPPVTSAGLLDVISEGSGELLASWLLAALHLDSLAIKRAFSIVCSSSAKWHWASSWLDDGEALARRGEEENDDREMGREGRGIDMGELMLSLFGGEDEGLMLSEEPKRERRLLPLSLSSIFSLGALIQEIFSGILRCWGGGPERRVAKRGGGGRGGGDCDTLSAVLSFWLLLLVSLFSSSKSEFWLRFQRLSWPKWLLSLWSEPQMCRLSPQDSSGLLLLVSRLLLTASSLRPWFEVVQLSPSGWWTFMKRGLMKQRAPLDWEHSSSDGVRVRSLGRLGVVSKETGLWAGGGGLSGAAIPDKETEPSLLWQNCASQTPVCDS